MNIMKVIGELWNWLKENDASNWVAIVFSLFAWPLFLRWLDARTKQGIPHLEIKLDPGQTQINGQNLNAVNFTFTNLTGRIIYLSLARLRERSRNFPVPQAAARGTYGAWREVKFAFPQPSRPVILDQHQIVLQTSASAVSNMAVSRLMDDRFYSHRPGWIRRWLRCPKYFRLEYIAMVGDKKYSIAMIY